MGGVVFTRRFPTSVLAENVCREYSDEWFPVGGIVVETRRGPVYAILCGAVDDVCVDRFCMVRFEWNRTIYDDTIAPDEREELERRASEAVRRFLAGFSIM